jgi:hypothetical protein
MSNVVEGQLNPTERQILTDAIRKAPKKPEVVIEVGTWLGGGSTLTFLRALHQNGTGHLWGVEADHQIYDRMIANLRAQAPDVLDYFTPLLGRSDQVIPPWIAEQKQPFQIDVAFLDGGNSPAEQIVEFQLLDPYFPVGAQLYSHDAKLRKGRWFVPYLSRLDNWEVRVHDVSAEGMLAARKIGDQPSADSLRAAKKHLCGLQMAFTELAARYTPHFMKIMLLSVMPRQFARRLTDGR